MKGQVKPSAYIYGIIFFMGVILGGMALIGEFRQTDNTFMSDSQTAAVNSTFNRYSDLTTSVNSLKNATSSTGNNWGVFGVLNSLFGTVWNAIVLLYTSLDFMTIVFNGLMIFGIPSWVSSLLSLSIIVIIAFAIISAISQVDQ